MLEVRNISVKYGDRVILHDVSLSLGEGEIIVLLGANGAGKTTLIKTLNGTLPTVAGTIEINGVLLTNMSRRTVAQNIAVVAQENETRFPVTVLEFVLSGRFVHGNAFGWESDTDMSVAAGAVAECDLAGFETRLMNHLSGGERQRAVLARALAAGAGLLLLDEPTANLDLEHQAMMFRLVRERCRHAGASSVVITHDLNLAAEFADQIIMLRQGRLLAKGQPKDVLTAENIKEVFGVKVLLDEHPESGKVRVTSVY